MTENKIKPTIEQVIYCLKTESERYPEVCEECPLYGEVGCDHCYDDVTDMAIKSLKELEQYRAIGTVAEIQQKDEIIATQKDIIDGVYKDYEKYLKIGTVEECRTAMNCKNYFSELYGEGLEVANWHKNGDLEPFDNFYDESLIGVTN